MLIIYLNSFLNCFHLTIPWWTLYLGFIFKIIRRTPFLLLTRSKEMSQGRLIIIATFLIIACIVALGLGLGFVLTKDRDSQTTPCGEVGTESGTTDPTPTTPGTTTSPGASPSLEGHYRYAAISSDTGSCAQIGT